MFRTEVQITPSQLNLTLSDKVVTIGSCFAEVIGRKLQEYKADVLPNPFGTIFNPVSVSRLLQAVAGTAVGLENSYVQRDGIWYSYDLHSSLSSPDREELKKLIERQVNQTREQLLNARLLILTLGTAVSYKLSDSGTIVANCHKLPSRHFTRELLTTQTIVESIKYSLAEILKLNPALQVILTVSPVRHVKETLQVNSVSKSILRVATHYLVEQLPYVHYFPAYEIMQDDLRDYRFYGPDMLHPTPVAEEYIWQKFIQAYLHPTYQQFIPAWDKMRRAIAHKPFHPDTEAHQVFLQKSLTQLHNLSETYPISTSQEEQMLRSQLKR